MCVCVALGKKFYNFFLYNLLATLWVLPGFFYLSPNNIFSGSAQLLLTNCHQLSSQSASSSHSQLSPVFHSSQSLHSSSPAQTSFFLHQLYSLTLFFCLQNLTVSYFCSLQLLFHYSYPTPRSGPLLAFYIFSSSHKSKSKLSLKRLK